MPALTRLDLYRIRVPLKKTIRHASHERSESENLIVQATLDDGSTGFGEGVPREYVTGETVDSAVAALTTFDAAAAFGRPSSLAQAVERISAMTLPSIAADPRGMFGNAARSALELALIDSAGHSFDATAGEAVRLACRFPSVLNQSPGWVRYSGAITAESSWNEWVSIAKMGLNGFHQIKLKVGASGQDDRRAIARIRAVLGPSLDVRLDANEAWMPDELLERLEPLRRYRPSAIEQPVPHRWIDALTEIRPLLKIPVMLDESLCGYPDGLRAVAQQTADLFNIRISKCGGLIPSIRLAELAKRAGLGVQLGCHPGETGILSAAGRHLASNLASLRYVEGSYDRHALSRNILREDITFGYRGWAPPLDGPGLGVTVEFDALRAMSGPPIEITYD